VIGSIPVIDLAPVSSVEGRRAVVRQVGAACETVGFFQVIGHGVPAEQIDAAHRAYTDLYSLPASVKEQWVCPVAFRGYSRPGSNHIEAFGVSNIRSGVEAAERGVPAELCDYFVEFPWPTVEGFQTAVSDLFDAERALAVRLMSLIAESTGLEPDHFDTTFRNDVSDFTCRAYTGGGPDDIVLGEHCDSGALTILHQRGNYDGLMVRRVDGELLTAPTREDALVVNLGEMIEIWTNGRYRATPHFVAMPAAGEWRNTVILFQQPAIDTVVAPVAQCVGDDGPRYAELRPYDHLRSIRCANRRNLARDEGRSDG
jgi:isopenicillin N synthase-like dioxygenase